MTEKRIHNIGILAYGSLINNPGQEISECEIDRIQCETPFKVELARISSTRGNAPTLIPVENGGKKVRAVIIALRDSTDIEFAKTILWRRELHKPNSSEIYTLPTNPTLNQVVIKTCDNFMNVRTVLYTSIGSNIEQPLTGELLAEYAISSILSSAGQEERDGIRYLLAAKRNSIVTELSADYEIQILKKTKTETLEQAIEMLDRQRMMYPNQK